MYVFVQVQINLLGSCLASLFTFLFEDMIEFLPQGLEISQSDHREPSHPFRIWIMNKRLINLHRACCVLAAILNFNTRAHVKLLNSSVGFVEALGVLLSVSFIALKNNKKRSCNGPC